MRGGREAPYGHGKLPVKVCTSDGNHHMPLKDLLREKNDWVWDGPQQAAFEKLKSGLSSPTALAQYSNTAGTKVAADASPYGIGAVLTQKQADNSW